MKLGIVRRCNCVTIVVTLHAKQPNVYAVHVNVQVCMCNHNVCASPLSSSLYNYYTYIIWILWVALLCQVTIIIMLLKLAVHNMHAGTKWAIQEEFRRSKASLKECSYLYRSFHCLRDSGYCGSHHWRCHPVRGSLFRVWASRESIYLKLTIWYIYW